MPTNDPPTETRGQETPEQAAEQPPLDPHATEVGGDDALPSDVRLAPDAKGLSSSDGLVGTDARVEETLAAPSMPAPVAQRSPAGSREFDLEPGQTIDDFEVIEVLGRGAFGVVYLARQLSLDRRVALKVTANRGSEGRTMARLEHANIVQVFSETVDATGRRRLLCMQLAPGASLESVIQALKLVALRRGAWTGADYLAAIDERTKVRETFDPSALREREMLSQACRVEASAWVGARLAEAINFAHANGVLHRDIKPANVLINQYGRPLLADFNISFRGASGGAAATTDGENTFGGTLAFMAPEHLDAFDPTSGATPDDVDERSDIYSLGIVVYELLAGRPPFERLAREGSRMQYVALLAEQRRAAPAPIEAGPPTARKVLERTVAKALAPEKGDRYETGEQFAAALDGCRHLANVERAAPPAGAFARSVIRRPLAWAMLLIFLPQVVGSVVNIAYNKLQIADLLSAEQNALFMQLVTWYNAVVYPLAVATLVYFFWPVFQMWRAVQRTRRLDAAQVDAVRRATLRLPLWVLAAAAVGWLPGGVLFPAILAWLAPPIGWDVFLHFFVSFAFSGLIAVAYSFCGMQYIVMRVLYPRLWTDATDFQHKAKRELRGVGWRTWFIEVTAYAIPTIAAVVLPAVFLDDDGGIPMRTLTSTLAVLGITGTIVVRIATGVMSKIQVALTGQG